ncbi:DISARM system helicase DrmA [Streptomyces carpaticus]|uniref:DISARM system helicase DrmA n=1 Tax=Streptomyces carpaticus TaxID=285558 RepID=UPI0022032AEA|nr:DISARM system helicase DrmA [Streptomyces carpaticus]
MSKRTPVPTSCLPPHPIDDVPQDFESGGSYQVRDELQSLIERDLLGPWDGEQEKLRHDAGPRDRYLVGMLGPRPDPPVAGAAGRRAAEVGDGGADGAGDGAESELPELLTPVAAGRMWASSMGLSFLVPASVGLLTVTASWGRYQRVQSETDEGPAPRVWAREQVTHRKDIHVTAPREDISTYLEGTAGTPHVRLDVRVRVRKRDPELRVVEISLVNELGLPDVAHESDWLFQTQLDVHAFPDPSTAVFLPLPETDGPAADPEEERLRLLYRDDHRYAAGRNVAVHAEVAADARNARRLTTTWLPTHDVPGTTGPGVDELPGLVLSMDKLAELSVEGRTDELATALLPLATGYRDWLERQRKRAAQELTDPAVRATAEAAVETAEEICGRIREGIATLTHPTSGRTAREAFRFANEVMARQRRNTAITELRSAAGDSTPLPYAQAHAEVKERGAKAASWFPFQLAFMLLNVPALTDPAHPHRGTGRAAQVDLLFFPTGGGKTEAYLGLAAYIFAARRLQGIVGEGTDARDGSAGIAVLMRYTLRLLTAQQFQRAAAMVAAAEVLRRRAWTAGDHRWGATPFRIGLWVGASVSPNSYDEAARQLGLVQDQGDGRHAGVMQVRSCPWCGEALHAHRDARREKERRRILFYCPRGEGTDPCPFSERGAQAFFGDRQEMDGIPVLTVDEEIYRLLPVMLIATVDKLAQLPWNGYSGLLFGRTTERCPRHGYRHQDLDELISCASRHRAVGGGAAKGGFDAVISQPTGLLRPPDLIIQDELHLISGALGTMVGLFESAVDQLCQWPVNGADGERRLTGPVIVASTATTKHAAQQVRGVFGRAVTIFPPPVLDHTDTFYSRRQPPSETDPGRRYLGVCAHGVRLKSAEIRIAEILLRSGQHLFDRYGASADPYMTLVGYFSSTRELAGMRRALDDQVANRVRFDLREPEREPAARLLWRAEMLSIAELTSRISSHDIGTALQSLQSGFSPEYHTTVRRRAIIRELAHAQDPKTRRTPRISAQQRATDVVLATSMLQVGVDVSRFGLMLVVGQPKNTAEYIQASSRVGRDRARPGLVVTLYNWSRPRDLAHFEDFGHYHATFYRQVEALSVTPFTRRALDRGTAAMLVAALRHAVPGHSRNTAAHTLDLDGPVVTGAVERLLARAEQVGGERARGYLADRIAALLDEWRQSRDGDTTLGYRAQTRPDERVRALLHRADGTGWRPFTVPNSLRETEHEINLLLGNPTGERPHSTGGPAPDWEFGGGQDTDDDEERGEQRGRADARTGEEHKENKA